LTGFYRNFFCLSDRDLLAIITIHTSRKEPVNGFLYAQ